MSDGIEQGNRTWGGLVPGDAAPAGGDAPPAIAGPQLPQTPPVRLSAEELQAERLGQLKRTLDQLMHHFQLLDEPAQLRALPFNANQLVLEDDWPRISRSIAIVNPAPAKIYLPLSGGAAQAGNLAFEVPKESFIVLPVEVGAIQIGVDAGELEAAEAIAWRLRFDTAQPFDMGAL